MASESSTVTAGTNATAEQYNDLYRDAVLNGFFTTAKARVYRGTSGQAVANATTVKVQFNAESYDPGADFDSTTDYDYTVPLTGYYDIYSQITLDSGVSNQQFLLLIQVNAVTVTQADLTFPTTNNISNNVKDLLLLTAGDLVTICVTQFSGSGKNILHGSEKSFFSIHFRSRD